MKTITIPEYFPIIIPRIYKCIYNDFNHRINHCPEYRHFLDKDHTYSLVIRPDDDEIFMELNYKRHRIDTILICEGREYGFLFSPDEFMYNFKPVYELCECNNLVEIEGMCEDCYIYQHHNDERCSICFEYDGRWCKLVCGHVFHNHCVSTIHKCPICRKSLELDQEYFPYY